MKPVKNVILESDVDGIPCKVRIDHFFHQPGMPARIAPSDLDHYGYTELEYTLLDRKGYPAPWLERKLEGLSEEKKENFETLLILALEK